MQYGGGVEEWRGHSILGIFSFVISALTGLVLLVLIVVLGVLEASTPGGIDDDSVWIGLLGLAVILCLIANFVGFGLGVAGLIQARKKRIFAILDAIFNGLILFAVAALILFGIGGLPIPPVALRGGLS